MTDDQIIAAIKRQRRGGARYPSPIPLLYGGQPTDYAEELGLVREDGRLLANADRQVHAAIKRLQSEGKLLFVVRFGYTWVVDASSYDLEVKRDGDMLVDTPINTCNLPYYWEQI